ncbi:transposable element Tcb1 transposase [Trichonephila clavipes]|nr:transposable element Tcb1 transposase [Trichonephila clavipes]
MDYLSEKEKSVAWRRVGRNQITLMRICDRWIRGEFFDGLKRGRSRPPQCTASSENRQIVCMKMTDSSVTSRTIAQHTESVTHHSVLRVPFNAVYSRVVCPQDVHCLVYPLTQNHSRLHSPVVR